MGLEGSISDMLFLLLPHHPPFFFLQKNHFHFIVIKHLIWVFALKSPIGFKWNIFLKKNLRKRYIDLLTFGPLLVICCLLCSWSEVWESESPFPLLSSLSPCLSLLLLCSFCVCYLACPPPCLTPSFSDWRTSPSLIFSSKCSPGPPSGHSPLLLYLTALMSCTSWSGIIRFLVSVPTRLCASSR